MYKVDTKTLKNITKLLDKIGNTKGRGISIQEEIQAKKLSQHIKDNYTQIKPQ